MPATPVWLAPVEAMLNRNLLAQPATAALRRRLSGKSLQVEIEGGPGLRASMCGDRLVLDRARPAPAGARPGEAKSAAEPAADAVISGAPGSLLRMLTGGATPAGPDGSGAVQVRGDAEVAAGFRELLARARPDLEEELARIVGDLPAHRAGVVWRGALSWARGVTRNARENLAEYLQEESRLLVNKTELEEFLHGVDELREAGDRAAARLARLEQRLELRPAQRNPPRPSGAV
jgi:ubiquinone biosynthesis protein UbiJ